MARFQLLLWTGLFLSGASPSPTPRLKSNTRRLCSPADRVLIVLGLRENSSEGLARGPRGAGCEGWLSSSLETERKPSRLPASLCFCDLSALSGGLLGGGSHSPQLQRDQGNAGSSRWRKPESMPGIGQSEQPEREREMQTRRTVSSSPRLGHNPV